MRRVQNITNNVTDIWNKPLICSAYVVHYSTERLCVFYQQKKKKTFAWGLPNCAKVMYPKLTRSDNKRNISLPFGWLHRYGSISRRDPLKTWTKQTVGFLPCYHKIYIKRKRNRANKTFRHTRRDCQRCCAFKCVLWIWIHGRTHTLLYLT